MIGKLNQRRCRLLVRFLCGRDLFVYSLSWYFYMIRRSEHFCKSSSCVFHTFICFCILFWRMRCRKTGLCFTIYRRLPNFRNLRTRPRYDSKGIWKWLKNPKFQHTPIPSISPPKFWSMISWMLSQKRIRVIFLVFLRQKWFSKFVKLLSC